MIYKKFGDNFSFFVFKSLHYYLSVKEVENSHTDEISHNFSGGEGILSPFPHTQMDFYHIKSHVMNQKYWDLFHTNRRNEMGAWTVSGGMFQFNIYANY